MIHYPLDAQVVLRNRSEAMRYFKLAQRSLAHRAEVLQADVLALEEPLRTATAFIIEALSRDCAHFDAKYLDTDAVGLGHGIGIDHLDINEDWVDAMEGRWGTEIVEESGWWLLQRLQPEPAIFISWALGEIRFPENNNRMVLEDRILYDMSRRNFWAVLSHQDWHDPACVEFYLGGGKKERRRINRTKR